MHITEPDICDPMQGGMQIQYVGQTSIACKRTQPALLLKRKLYSIRLKSRIIALRSVIYKIKGSTDLALEYCIY